MNNYHFSRKSIVEVRVCSQQREQIDKICAVDSIKKQTNKNVKQELCKIHTYKQELKFANYLPNTSRNQMEFISNKIQEKYELEIISFHNEN